jgi:HlyD family secretion protein
LLVYGFTPQPVEADVARVARGPLQVTVDQEGKTRIKERYVVSAPLAGRLFRITLQPGDPVQTSKTLVAAIEPADPALLDPRAMAEAEARVKAADAARRRASANLDRALAAFDLARSDLARTRRLYAQQGTSSQELETAMNRERLMSEDQRSSQFAVQVAEFELEQAKAAMLRTKPTSTGDATERFEILAPIDGQVLRVFQKSAAVVTPGTRLLELGDPADLEAEIDLLSTDAVKVRPGARVQLVHWGGRQPLPGRVRLVEPAAFTKQSALGVEEQRVNVIVDFVGPLEQRRALGDAYRVEAQIVIWEEDNVLKVPSGSLFRQGDQWAVFRLEDGRAKLTPVQVGENNGLEAQIQGGLQEQDQVIVHPSDRIREGGRVKPR